MSAGAGGTGPGRIDADLLDRLRAGDDTAYDALYREHAPAVRRFALSVRRPGIDVDDVVAEVFLRVLRAVRAGHGPRDYVRTYLLTAVRRVLTEWLAARRDEPMRADQLGERAGYHGDHQVQEAERELLAQAFDMLPDRWRTVLWRTEVEGHRPASIADEFGLTPNATAVLAHRARRGLRAAYLEASSAGSRTRTRRPRPDPTAHSPWPRSPSE